MCTYVSYHYFNFSVCQTLLFIFPSKLTPLQVLMSFRGLPMFLGLKSKDLFQIVIINPSLLFIPCIQLAPSLPIAPSWYFSE